MFGNSDKDEHNIATDGETMSNLDNATFYAFKFDGKWYSTARGHLPETTFTIHDSDGRRQSILDANEGKFPGLSGPCAYYTWVIVGDDKLNYGWPLMFNAIVD